MKHLTPSPARSLVPARLLLAIIFTLLLAVPASRPARAGAWAHPAPSVIHDYVVVVNPAYAEVTMRLMVAPQLVPQVYRTVDTDFDALTSDAEQAAWVEAFVDGLGFEIDGNPASFTLVGAGKLTREALLLSMSKAVAVNVRVDFGPLEPSTEQQPVEHRLTISDDANYVGYDEYYASFRDGPGVIVTARDVTSAANPAVFEAIFEIDPSAAPAADAGYGGLAPTPPQEPAGGELLAQLDEFLRRPGGDLPFALFIFLLAVGVGALHALTPGHGKAVVAAYLAGTRGRVQDAMVLGLVVTLTHTSSVVLLGLALLLVNNFAMPRYLQPLLEVLSGLLIVVLGLWLLAQRWRAVRAAQPGHAAAHAHEHAHVPVLALAGGGSAARAHHQGAGHGSGGGHVHYHDGHTHSHGPGDDHAHDHSHGDHSHHHPHEDRQARGHGGFVHSHGGQAHSHAIPANVSLRDLVGLGISGGLVPCPDALAIMLLAAGFSQIGLGLALVTSFSIGLAATLMGIGVLMVKARGLLERMLPGDDGNRRWITWLPVASAVVVILLGVAVMLGAAVGQRWV